MLTATQCYRKFSQTLNSDQTKGDVVPKRTFLVMTAALMFIKTSNQTAAHTFQRQFVIYMFDTHFINYRLSEKSSNGFVWFHRCTREGVLKALL